MNKEINDFVTVSYGSVRCERVIMLQQVRCYYEDYVNCDRQTDGQSLLKVLCVGRRLNNDERYCML